MSIKPFSDNIVFLDTEFNGNDPYVAELLSLGMVTMDGRDFYAEIEFTGELDPWVKENVEPYLTGKKISREKVVKQASRFVGTAKPQLISFINAFDYVYLTKLFTRDIINSIFKWPPLDFGSVLWGNGIDPTRYYEKTENNLFSELKIDLEKYNRHNALDDAKLLREVYLKMIK